MEQNEMLKRYQQLLSLLTKRMDGRRLDLKELCDDVLFLSPDDTVIRFLDPDGRMVLISSEEGGDIRRMPIDVFSERIIDDLLRMMTKAFVMMEIKEYL